MQQLASLRCSLSRTVWTLERSHLASSDFGDGLTAQHMPTGKHLGRVFWGALLTRDRTGKGAVKDEFAAQLQVDSQLRGRLKLHLLLACDLGRQLEQCGQRHRTSCHTDKERTLIGLQS